MPEIALHILDLVENCIKAGASCVHVTIVFSGDTLTVTIRDDGCGMDEAFLARVTSPFTTSRTTRKVGLGIPMFKQLSEMCEGAFSIRSKKGEGTEISATFRRNHVDLPPMGDLAGTMKTLVAANPERPEFCLTYRMDEAEFVFDTRAVREMLPGVSLAEIEVLQWIGEYVQEGIESCAGQNDTEQNVEV